MSQLKTLEAEVKREYNLEQALSLLRLYQASPEQADPTIIIQLLLRTFTQLPGSDTHLCLHLLPDRIAAQAPLPVIQTMAAALGAGEFTKFWGLAATLKEQVDATPGFEEAVRAHVLASVALAHQKVTLEALGPLLNLEGPALTAYAQKKGLAVEGNLVALAPTEFNGGLEQVQRSKALPFDTLIRATTHVA
eukprot:CAMPEP_0170141350 /NCGR_PEP_ID=MMETSP0033_2-20121228/6942_1 /TAXON_ID=195969 /ORGANISM="Dolichomastix tenuilepis, Strain CCMP3274" /LENGTH=191 /DNA_ID=CAMNT_0010377613 /DNA_START=38 /DNA_END=613 /DNA_ORIENTATION=+